MTSTDYELITELKGHSETAWSVSFHPHRPLLSTCSSDKQIHLYAFNPTTLSFTLHSTLSGTHTRTIRHVSFSNDGRLSSSGFDSVTNIYEPDTTPDSDWEVVATHDGHESEVKCSEFSYNSQLFATCGRDKTVWIWEAPKDEECTCLAVLMNHQADVKSLTWHPSQEILASASYDDTIQLYAADPSTDEWIVTHVLPPQPSHTSHLHTPAKHTGHTSTVWSIKFSPCGNYLISSSADSTLKIWACEKFPRKQGEPVRIGASERESWRCVKTIQGCFSKAVLSVDWATTGWRPQDEGGVLGKVVAAGADGSVVLFGIVVKDEEISYHVLTKIEAAHGFYEINCVKFCNLTPGEATTSENNDVEMSDAVTDRYSEARKCIATAGDDGVVKIWKLSI